MPQVVIDPGHGGHDVEGRSTPYGERAGAAWEKDLNLRLAERVVAHLGTDAVLTRSEDRNLALGDRAALARASRARAFVSLHGHVAPGDTDIYVHPRAGMASHQLGRAVQRELGNGHRGDGGLAMGELAVLHPETLGADTAACLVECGYPVDAGTMMRDPWAFDRLGSAIARGVRSFLGDASAYGRPARFTPPGSTAIAINTTTTWMSEHFIAVSDPGDLSINGQVTANGQPNDPSFVIQVDGVATPGHRDPGVLLHETLQLTPGTPMLFARTVAIATPGRYRIVFFMADWNQPPSLSVMGSFFL